MPNPNAKFSKARRSQRRAQYYNRLEKNAPELTSCSNCGATHQLHRACPSCGQYRGRQIVAVKTDA